VDFITASSTVPVNMASLSPGKGSTPESAPLKRQKPNTPAPIRLDLDRHSGDSPVDPACGICSKSGLSLLPKEGADASTCLCGAYTHFSCAKLPFASASSKSSAKTRYLYLASVAILCPVCSGNRPDLHIKPRGESSDTPQCPPGVQDLSVKLDSLASEVARLSSAWSSFAAPVPQKIGRPSYAYTAGSGLQASQPQPSLVQSISLAVQRGSYLIKEEEDAAKSIVCAGLPLAPKSERPAQVTQLLRYLDIPASMEPSLITQLPQPKASDPAQVSKPPLVKVQFDSAAPVRLLLSRAKDLKDSESASIRQIFIRPARTKEQLALLRAKSKRRDFLNAQDKVPDISYAIQFSSQDFRIIKLCSGKPDWAWHDSEFKAWAESGGVAVAGGGSASAGVGASEQMDFHAA
jgi:hypothetical protein